MRMHVLPKRNNAHLNNTSKSPLLAIAHGANHDIKYIDTPIHQILHLHYHHFLVFIWLTSLL